jgi:SAM-dependent methyltransferase
VRAREQFAEVFADALRGSPCHVVGFDHTPRALPLTGWTALRGADRALLDECVGATLDVGCGPGRMTAALVRRGHCALGVDLVPEAVAQTRRRGACALQRDVFAPLPGEGRWETALLADGNIGIGGDPLALLARLRTVLAPAGRVVCELAEPGTGLRTVAAHLECAGRRSPRFRWTLVGPEAVPVLAARSGFVVRRTGRIEDRWFAVIQR